MPTGATRIAAPFVVPCRPDSEAGTPARMAATAAFVDGPSRSSEPRSRIRCSQTTRRSANSAGSRWPSPSMSASATSTACSVSSVIDPAGSPAAIG